jgi:hypothetical protein
MTPIRTSGIPNAQQRQEDDSDDTQGKSDDKKEAPRGELGHLAILGGERSDATITCVLSVPDADFDLARRVPLL